MRSLCVRTPWLLLSALLLAAPLGRVDYTVATGRSAGASGILDHSTRADYATPFVGLQWTRPLGKRFLLSPRALAVAPLPPADFTGRTTGPGFDLSSDTSVGGRAGQIGDAFVDFGLEIQHRPTGLAIDLGSALYFAGAESISHPGVSRAVTVQLIWHRLTHVGSGIYPIADGRRGQATRVAARRDQDPTHVGVRTQRLQGRFFRLAGAALPNMTRLARSCSYGQGEKSSSRGSWMESRIG